MNINLTPSSETHVSAAKSSKISEPGLDELSTDAKADVKESSDSFLSKLASFLFPGEKTEEATQSPISTQQVTEGETVATDVSSKSGDLSAMSDGDVSGGQDESTHALLASEQDQAKSGTTETAQSDQTRATHFKSSTSNHDHAPDKVMAEGLDVLSQLERSNRQLASKAVTGSGKQLPDGSLVDGSLQGHPEPTGQLSTQSLSHRDATAGELPLAHPHEPSAALKTSRILADPVAAPEKLVSGTFSHLQQKDAEALSHEEADGQVIQTPEQLAALAASVKAAELISNGDSPTPLSGKQQEGALQQLAAQIKHATAVKQGLSQPIPAQSNIVQGDSTMSQRSLTQGTTEMSPLLKELSAITDRPLTKAERELLIEEMKKYQMIQHAQVARQPHQLSTPLPLNAISGHHGVQVPDSMVQAGQPVYSTPMMAGMNPEQIMQAQRLDPRQNLGRILDSKTLKTAATEALGGTKEAGLAQQLSAMVGQQVSPTPMRPEAQQVQPNLVYATKDVAADQLSERVQMMMSKNLKNIDIRLDPPELGQMRIRLHMNGDQAMVHFTVANTQARDALEHSLPRLREMLTQQGVQLGETSVQHQGSQQHGQPSTQQGGPFGQSATTSRSGHDHDAAFADESMDGSVVVDMNVAKGSDGISYYA